MELTCKSASREDKDVFPETADIETSSDEYAARFSGAIGAWMLKTQEKMVWRLLRDHAKANILDVGGGHGQLARPLCRDGYALTVVGSAESCRWRIADLIDEGRCRFVVANVLRLPFEDAAFDTVLCFRLLPHCERWLELIAELCRVARRAVIVDYPTSQSLNCFAPGMFAAKRRLEGNTRPFRLFQHAEIIDAFQRQGFALSRRNGQFVLPMVAHRALKIRPLSALAENTLRFCGLARRYGSPVIASMRRCRSADFKISAPACNIPAGTRVLVTGATGFTGAILARKLVMAGLEVHAIARASSKREALGDLQIQWHIGNVFDEKTVAEAVRGVEYIFHVAAAYREARHADTMYAKVHVLSTQLLAEAARRNPGFKRFVHISTVGVHGHIANPPADELYSIQPGDIYQTTKADAEIWLRDFAQKTKLPFAIIRPAAIYGPGDTRLLKFFRMASRPVMPLFGHGRQLYHLIHVDDLTNVIILAATHSAALGEIFICGNPECVTLERMARIVAAELDNPLRIIRLPTGLFFVAADICEWICRKIGVEPPIHRRRLAFFTKDRSFNTGKLREKLGYQVRYTDEEGIVQTTRWYCDQGWLKRDSATTPPKK